MSEANGHADWPPPIDYDLGLMTCTRCRAVHHGAHVCTMTRPEPARRPAPKGAFDNYARVPTPGYGYRVGLGCYLRYGSEDDHGMPGRRRRWRPMDPNPANSAAGESFEEKYRWQKHRLQGDFAARAPVVALATFRAEVAHLGLHQRQAGDRDPPGSIRYRVMGVAQLDGPELEIDLGIWVGPWHRVDLDAACAAAAYAVSHRWSSRAYCPQARAGFAWGDARIQPPEHEDR